MTKLTRAALAGALMTATGVIATPAFAQASPAIVIVDMNRIAAESAASKSAEPQLKAKFDSVQARTKTLDDQFKGEIESLQKARPSMAQEAFQAKARDIEQRRVTAAQEIQSKQQDYARSVQYVNQQIVQAVNPIITAVMREKGASIALDQNVTLAAASSLDVTADVLTRLNAALPRVSITPPAQPAPAPVKK
jgi:Skp family chaperone for outer membrane proteins